MLALTPGEARRRPSASAGSRLLEQAAQPAHEPAWPASWCWPPTSSSSRRPAASRTRPGPRRPATRSARVIAGYHWFTDWGRDTMISLEGLTLATGRARRGRLHPAHLRPLRPRRPDPQPVSRGREARASTTPPTPRSGSSTPLDRYVAGHRRPRDARRCCCPSLQRHHRPPPARHALRHRRRSGRRPAAPGRRGLSAHLDGRQGRRLGRDAAARQGGGDQRAVVQRPAAAGRLGRARTRRRRGASRMPSMPSRRRQSFNARFWYEQAAISTTWSTASSGDDPACRPNQVFAISLRHPVLDRERWEPVLDVVRERLLTPVGLRSLAPGHPDYKPRYYGDLRSRDAAYHQGTVWAWLIGPFIDAWLKVHPDDRAGARAVPRRLRAATWARRASARSARSSTPRRRSRRAAASPRPGAWRRCCAPG